jgi:UDPglucose 6-dehydrogenase
MKIAVLGTGYVGLVTGICLANWGHEVICIDSDPVKIGQLTSGKVPFFEPGLQDLLASARQAGRIAFSNDLSAGLCGRKLVFVAVGTPHSVVDGGADLSFVFAAAQEIARLAQPGMIIAMKSTVPVGTGDRVEELIARVRGRGDVTVISNPEFLREGSAVADFDKPDRVVIGTESSEAKRVMLDVYRPLVAKKVPVLFTERRTSELIKYASNAFLATKIAFINEMSDLCERIGAEITDLSLGIGLDQRIGPSFLSVGPGYGGSCFPKDTLALARTARENEVRLGLVNETINSNNARKEKMAARVIRAMDHEVAGKIIAILGLSFKANTDDMRESPALPLVESLQSMGARIRAYDPAAMVQAARLLKDVEFSGDAYECVQGAHGLVVVTEWPEFKRMDLSKLRAAMTGSVLVDLRNIVNAEAARRSGFTVTRLGQAEGRTSQSAFETAFKQPKPDAIASRQDNWRVTT